MAPSGYDSGGRFGGTNVSANGTVREPRSEGGAAAVDAFVSDAALVPFRYTACGTLIAQGTRGMRGARYYTRSRRRVKGGESSGRMKRWGVGRWRLNLRMRR